MEIILHNIGKRFSNKEWVFKDLSFHFETGAKVAITGSNGSGKSTLLRSIGGMTLLSLGEISYFQNETEIDPDQLLNHLSFVSPYLELIEEFSLSEMIKFHFSFKKIRQDKTIKELIEEMYFQGHEHKLIKNFSSGMKQRLKLGLCFFTESDLILLDEPTSNLDQKGIDWYISQIRGLHSETLIIIASNEKQEYSFCNKIIKMG